MDFYCTDASASAIREREGGPKSKAGDSTCWVSKDEHCSLFMFIYVLDLNFKKSELTVCFLGVFLRNTCDAPFLLSARPSLTCFPPSGMCTVARATRSYPSFNAKFICHLFYDAAPNLLSQNQCLSGLSPVSFCISCIAHIQPSLQTEKLCVGGGGGWICIPNSPTNL